MAAQSTTASVTQTAIAAIAPVDKAESEIDASACGVDPTSFEVAAPPLVVGWAVATESRLRALSTAAEGSVDSASVLVAAKAVSAWSVAEEGSSTDVRAPRADEVSEAKKAEAAAGSADLSDS